MEARPIVENSILPEPPPAASAQPALPDARNAAESEHPAGVRFPGEDGGQSLAAMAQRDLIATLQLLAERAQYITGATGAAIALRDEGEMTCRASAGTSAPEVGAHLQVDSGLSGESVRTRKTLRCDDAATDPRVNRESCEALGIASVVVMPLARGKEVIGVFELFSDKPNVFQARDITALERMGAMVFTAMEHALAALQAKADTEADSEVATLGSPGESGGGAVGESQSPHSSALVEASGIDVAGRGQTGDEAGSTGSHEGVPLDEAAGSGSFGGVAFHMKIPAATDADRSAPRDNNDADSILEIADKAFAAASETHAAAQPIPMSTDALSPQAAQASAESTLPSSEPEAALAPEGDAQPEEQGPTRNEVSSLRRCEGCGFPVSEGRQFCLDCERKAIRVQRVAARDVARGVVTAGESARESSAPPPVEIEPTPQFLHDVPQRSWLVTHKYTVGAMVIAVAGIVIFMLTR